MSSRWRRRRPLGGWRSARTVSRENASPARATPTQELPMTPSTSSGPPSSDPRRSGRSPASDGRRATRACLLCVSCFVRERRGMTTATTPRHQVLTDKQWERIEPMLPSNTGRKGRPFHDNRKIVEGIIYRARTGIPWRDLPREQFGPWQTVWKRHYLYARLGVWDRIHAALMAQADAAGDIEWMVSVDSTINRDHQHGTNTTLPDQPTEGDGEPQQSGS